MCCCVCCCVFRPNLRITMYTSIYQRIPAYTRSAFDLVALLSVCSVYSLCEPFRYLPAVKVKSHCLIHGFTASRTLALLPADTVQPSPCASSATTPSNFCTLPLFCQSYATEQCVTGTHSRKLSIWQWLHHLLHTLCAVDLETMMCRIWRV